jgi:cholesterol oxidase
MPDFDVIVAGSGFGGAVVACRLAEAGARVLVLERGRRWTAETFPREPDDPWIWDEANPDHGSGWFDLRIFPHMSVVMGAGVGGGSLVYANISIEAKPDTFAHGWPAEVTFSELKPHYDTVGRMLNVQRVPTKQWPERTRLMRDAAHAAGWDDRFRPLELAVTFDPDWTYDLPDAHNLSHSRRFTNAEQASQGTCVHLGNCDIGCEANARNTLDLNYLARAERHGADIRPLQLVSHVEPVAGGYRVHHRNVGAGSSPAGFTDAAKVVLAAGSLGSTGILLRSRDQYRTLPRVSSVLGKGWSSNGDFLTPALHFMRRVDPVHGPTITSAIDLLDGQYQGQPIFVEDGGFPNVAGRWIERMLAKPTTDPRLLNLLNTLRPLLAGNALDSNVMPWFAQARDAADGVLTLNDGQVFLTWDVHQSRPVMDAVAAVHRKLAIQTAGLPLTALTWTVAQDLITPHPLGGCNMAATAATGVVDHTGTVFGYPGLFVADGAIVPKAIGLNPSRTIAALAERVATFVA